MKARPAEQEEDDEVAGKEGADDLKHAARMHGAHQQPVGRNHRHEQQCLYPNGIASELGIAFSEEERFADRTDQVISPHEHGGLQEPEADAASFTRLHLGGQGEDALESAEVPPGIHWGKARPRKPGDLSTD